MTAINPNTDMTLGTAKLLFDTGSVVTSLSRADAQSMGLLNAAGNPVASLYSGVLGAVKGVPGYAISIGLRLSITGKNAAGTDIGNRVFPLDEKNVVYPFAAGIPDVPTVLGTNVIKELPPEQRTPSGDLRYAVALPADPNRTIALGSLAQQNFTDVATGQPINNPLIAGALPVIQNATVGSPTNAMAANLVNDTGSPYTIISQALASALDLKPEGLKGVVAQSVRRTGSGEKIRNAQPLCIMLVRIEIQRVVLFEDCIATGFLAPGPALGRCEHNPQQQRQSNASCRIPSTIRRHAAHLPSGASYVLVPIGYPRSPKGRSLRLQTASG
jgi:hypothetical protein